MPVPAVSVAPRAVLVLAWDETTPAVRTLLAAVQAEHSPIDSILMMVPQAEAPGELSAAEYLPPLPAAVAELAEPSTDAADKETSESVFQASDDELATAAELLPLATPLAPPAAAQPEPALAPAASVVLPPAAPLAVASPGALAWTAVRILRLSSFSLPELAQRAGQPLPAPTWMATAATPSAPYLGATAALASQLAPTTPVDFAPDDALPQLVFTSAPAPFAIAGRPLGASPPQPVIPPASALAASFPPTYLAAESAALAPDLEADMLPTEGDELAGFELAHANLLPADGSLLADDSLLLDELSPAASPSNPEPLPEQAGWPEALAALRQPAPLAEPELTDVAAAEQTEFAPLVWAASRSYSAPDLNFQVIQYARFAVPLALADAAFEAIYAPAWPTWLAAQELRQRTGRPLVLHVAALAAPAEESLDTATGWAAELQRQALRRADLVLTQTLALAYRLRHELGLPATAVRTVAATDAEAVAQALRTVLPRAKASAS